MAKKKGFLDVVRERTGDKDSRELKNTVENYKRQQQEREQESRTAGSVGEKKDLLFTCLNSDNLKEYYPNLTSLGWTTDKSEQVVKIWEVRGRDIEDLFKCLEIAEIMATDKGYIASEFEDRGHNTLEKLFASIRDATIHLRDDYIPIEEWARKKRIEQLKRMKGM